MSTISDARLDVAETLAAALPGLPVWAYPPNNMAAPCAFVQLGAGLEQPIADKWNAELIVTLVGPGGDNDTAILALEKMIVDAAQAISRAHLAPVTWQTPGVLTISGVPYFSARLTVPIDVEPTGGIIQPPPVDTFEFVCPLPAVAPVGDSVASFHAGLRFKVSADYGTLTHVRTWMNPAVTNSTGWRIQMWDAATGALFKRHDFDTPTVLGDWTDIALPEPWALDRDRVYILSLWVPPDGMRAYVNGFLGEQSGPLEMLPDTPEAPVGVFDYLPDTVPTQAWPQYVPPAWPVIQAELSRRD